MAKKRNPLELGYKWIQIIELVPAEWNYKKDDEFKAEKLKNNIERNGQIENIIVRQLPNGLYEIVNGNHRFDVLKELGIKKVMCYDLGDISVHDAKRIAIETNETRFDTDMFLLSDRINEIRSIYDMTDLISTFPFTKQELDNLINLNELAPEVDFDDLDAYSDPNAKMKTIQVVVNSDVYKMWHDWQDKCNELMGYDSPAKCIEFALQEALNIPDESLK